MKNTANNRCSISSKNKYLMAGMVISSALVLTRPILPATVYALDNKYNWTKQDLDLIGGEQYNQVASSASGSNLIASSYNFSDYASQQQPLYVSNNYGATWQNVAEAADAGVSNLWTSVDVSNDGQIMVAASVEGYDLDAQEGQNVIQGGDQPDIPGKIVLSQDAGASWSDITPDNLMEGGESRVVVSGDGNTLAIAIEDNVYVSGDGGDNWINTAIVEDNYNQAWSIAISDNGEKLLVGTAGSGSEFDNIYITDDGGTNWTGIATPASQPISYTNTAISADGRSIAVSGVYLGENENDYADYAFTSSNDGATWTDVTPENNAFNLWTSIDMSDDGNKLAMFGIDYEPSTGGEDVSMYVSDDSGASWTQENTDENEAGSLFDFYTHSNVDLNSDGSRAIVARVSGIYLGQAVSPTVTLTDPNSSKTITLTTPEGTTITCHTAVKESGLSVKDIAYDYPLGLVDFCFSGAEASNEISIVFVTNLKPGQVVARKYHATNGTYFNLPNATITQTSLEGQPALRVTYNIVDNGPLDLNPATGEVADPVGLAVAELGAPATGIAPANITNTRLATLLTGIAIITSLLMIPIRRVAGRVGLKK